MAAPRSDDDGRERGGVELVPVVDEGLGNSAYLVDLGDGGALVVDPPRDLRAVRAAAGTAGCGSRSPPTPTCTPTSSPAPVQLADDDGAHGAGLGRRAPRVRPPRPARRRRGRPRRADAARAGHPGAHRRAPVVPAARRRPPGRGVHRRVADRRARRPAPTCSAPDRTEELARAQYALAAAAGRAAGRRPRCGPRTAPARSARPRPAPSAPPPSAARRPPTRCWRIRDEDAFVERLLGSLGSYPPYFLRLAEINRRGPAVLDAATTGRLARLPVSAVRGCCADGAVVVDVRPVRRLRRRAHPGRAVDPAARAVRHLARLARPDPTRPLVIVRNPDQDLDRDRLAGAEDRLRPARRRARRRHRRLGRRRAADRRPPGCSRPTQIDGRRVLDVRQDARVHRRAPARRASTSSSATSPDGRRTRLPDAPTVVMCGHGERADGRGQPARTRRAPRPGRARRRARGLGHAPPASRWTPGRDQRAADPGRRGWGCGPTSPSSACWSRSTPWSAACSARNAPCCRCSPSTSSASPPTPRADLHPRLRRDQGRHQLLRRHLSDRYGRKPVLVAGWLIGAARSRCC